MVTAFRGPARKFCFVECAGQPAERELIATKLKERYRTYAYEYGLHGQMQSLQMQPGNYTTYEDRFSELAGNLSGMNPTHVMYEFLNGLTADYKQHVLSHGATSFAEVQETCRRLDLARRTSQHTRPSALASAQRERGSFTWRKPTTSPRGTRPGA